MKLQDSIVSGLDVKIQPAVYVKPNAFGQMWTRNNQNRRVSNPHLIIALKEAWQQKVGGDISIQDEKVLIDLRHAYQIDPSTKQVNQLSDKDLLKLDASEICIDRAIITLYAKGMHPDYYPTLAIVLTEKGEKYCFGETVKVCSNFTVFNSKYFIDTTKFIKNADQKYTTEMAVEYFQSHVFSRTEQNFETDFHEIERFRQQKISKKEFLSFMGEQHRAIEYANHSRLNGRIANLTAQQKELPVNSRQLSKIAVESFAPSHEEYQWQDDTTNLWNVVNFGTEILKAEKGTDVATLIESNMKWVNLVRSYPFVLN